MSIPIFLSHPRPCNARQLAFVQRLHEILRASRIEARTLGIGDYDMHAPLAGIRRLMMESNGILVVAFARYEIKNGRQHYQDETGSCNSKSISGRWMTSPWCHIEAGMGFQLGLTLLVFRERRILTDGVLEHGAIGVYMPEFDLGNEPEAYFSSEECKQLVQQFESQVIQYRDKKGTPRPVGW